MQILWVSCYLLYSYGCPIKKRRSIKCSVLDRSIQYNGLYFILFRFRPIIVKETIHTVLGDRLAGKVYDADETTDLCKVIADDIKTKLKGTINTIQLLRVWDTIVCSFACFSFGPIWIKTSYIFWFWVCLFFFWLRIIYVFFYASLVSLHPELTSKCAMLKVRPINEFLYTPNLADIWYISVCLFIVE